MAQLLYNYGCSWQYSVHSVSNVQGNNELDLIVDLVTPYDVIELGQIDSGNGLLPDAPNHCLNHCWLIISGALWHLHNGNLTANAYHISSRYEFENYKLKITATFRMGQWVTIHMMAIYILYTKRKVFVVFCFVVVWLVVPGELCDLWIVPVLLK